MSTTDYVISKAVIDPYAPSVSESVRYSMTSDAYGKIYNMLASGLRRNHTVQMTSVIIIPNDALSVTEEMSQEELFFTYFLETLYAKNIILDYKYQPFKFNITPLLSTQTFTSQSRNGNKTEKSVKKTPLMAAHTYTPDFLVVWNLTSDIGFRMIKPLGHKISVKRHKFSPFYVQFLENNYVEQVAFDFHMGFPLIRILGSEGYATQASPFSIIDVKASANGRFLRQEGLIKFPLKQHLLLMNAGIYVQKVRVPEIFDKTFSPEEFLMTDKTHKPRKAALGMRNWNEYFDYVDRSWTRKSNPLNK